MEKALPLFTVGIYVVLLLHYLSTQQLKYIYSPTATENIRKLRELQVVTVKMQILEDVGLCNNFE